MNRIFICPVLGFLFLLLNYGYAEPDTYKEIKFFCGSAVRVPMDEIIRNYRKEKNIEVSVIYSGSGALLSQMQLSKRGDVYLSGSPDFIEIGENKNLLIKNTDKLVAYLVPAIIVPKNNPKNINSLEDLAGKNIRIGLGNPETVCLGLYGIEVLERNNLLKNILPNVVVFAKSCSDTAMLTVLNKVDAVIGWDVFESWNPNDVKWIKIDGNKIPRLAYIALALPVFVKDQSAANNFIEYILSKKGMDVFKKWGYFTDLKSAKKFAPKAAVGGKYKLPEEYYKIIRYER